MGYRIFKENCPLSSIRGIIFFYMGKKLSDLASSKPGRITVDSYRVVILGSPAGPGRADVVENLPGI